MDFAFNALIVVALHEKSVPKTWSVMLSLVGHLEAEVAPVVVGDMVGYHRGVRVGLARQRPAAAGFERGQGRLGIRKEQPVRLPGR